MKIRFRTSVGGPSFAYMEGQTLDLPTPIPVMFQNWIRKRVIEVVRDDGPDVAVVDVPERAVLVRRRRGGRRASAVAG